MQKISQLEKQESSLIHQLELQKIRQEEEIKRLESEYELKYRIAEFEIEKRIIAQIPSSIELV